MGIIWGDVPPDEATCPHLAIKRTPAKGKLDAIVLSSRIVGCWTHFFGGQTIPCTGPSCPACEAKNGRRWHGYLGMYHPGERLTFLLELTAVAIQPIVEVQERTGSIRGVQLACSRISNATNARICVRVNEAARGRYAIPDEPDVRACLGNIWKLESSTRFPKHQSYEREAQQMLDEEVA
jgi:hypothetical protein